MNIGWDFHPPIFCHRLRLSSKGVLFQRSHTRITAKVNLLMFFTACREQAAFSIERHLALCLSVDGRFYSRDWHYCTKYGQSGFPHAIRRRACLHHFDGLLARPQSYILIYVVGCRDFPLCVGYLRQLFIYTFCSVLPTTQGYINVLNILS